MSNGNGTGKIEYVDPASLRNDGELDSEWPLDPADDPSEMAFIDDVGARGVLDPLKVSPEGRFVWDGRRRLRAARQYREKIRSVPVIRCRAEDRVDVIMGGIFHRRNLSKSAQIYLSRPWWRQVKATASKRSRQNLLRGGKRKGGFSTQPVANLESSPEESSAGLAQKYGVNQDEFSRCEQVVKLFSEHPDLKEQWEPKLLSGKASFWNILSGYKGLLEGKKHEGQAPAQFRAPAVRQSFFALKTLAVRLLDFESLTEKDKKTIHAELQPLVGRRKNLTADALESLGRYVKAEFDALAEVARKAEEEE